MQTPNSDTPYSMLGMYLRPEPIVLPLPSIEQDRYFSVQIIDVSSTGWIIGIELTPIFKGHIK